MGDCWERLIRSVRHAFNATVGKTTLDDFELMIVFSEVEAMVNNRPLTKASEDPNDMTLLTPSICYSLVQHAHHRLSALRPTSIAVAGDTFNIWRTNSGDVGGPSICHRLNTVASGSPHHPTRTLGSGPCHG